MDRSVLYFFFIVEFLLWTNTSAQVSDTHADQSKPKTNVNSERIEHSQSISVNVPIAKGYVEGDGTLSVPVFENGRRVRKKRLEKISTKKHEYSKLDTSHTPASPVHFPIAKGYMNADGTLRFPEFRSQRKSNNVPNKKVVKHAVPQPSEDALPSTET